MSDELEAMLQQITIAGYQYRLEWEQLDAALPLDWPHGWSLRSHFCESGLPAAIWLKQWLDAFASTPDRHRNLRLSRRSVGEWEATQPLT